MAYGSVQVQGAGPCAGPPLWKSTLRRGDMLLFCGLDVCRDDAGLGTLQAVPPRVLGRLFFRVDRGGDSRSPRGAISMTEVSQGFRMLIEKRIGCQC